MRVSENQFYVFDQAGALVHDVTRAVVKTWLAHNDSIFRGEPLSARVLVHNVSDIYAEVFSEN